MAGTVKDIKIWILFASVFAAAIPNGVVRYVLPVIPQLMELEIYDAQQLLLNYYVRLRLLLVQTNWIVLFSKDMGFSSAYSSWLHWRACKSISYSH